MKGHSANCHGAESFGVPGDHRVQREPPKPSSVADRESRLAVWMLLFPVRETIAIRARIATVPPMIHAHAVKRPSSLRSTVGRLKKRAVSSMAILHNLSRLLRVTKRTRSNRGWFPELS